MITTKVFFEKRFGISKVNGSSVIQKKIALRNALKMALKCSPFYAVGVKKIWLQMLLVVLITHEILWPPMAFLEKKLNL